MTCEDINFLPILVLRKPDNPTSKCSQVWRPARLRDSLPQLLNTERTDYGITSRYASGQVYRGGKERKHQTNLAAN